MIRFWSGINCILLHWPKKLTLAGMAIATNIMKTDADADIMMVQLVRILSSRPHFNDFFPHELYQYVFMLPFSEQSWSQISHFIGVFPHERHVFSSYMYVNYSIVASTSPSHFEAHAGLFRLLMKGIFDAYVLLVKSLFLN